MTAPAPTTGPTPNNMPPGPAGGKETDGTITPGDGDGDDAGGDGQPELTYEQLQAEAEKWKTQARKNEQRAKANADKAKQFDTVAEKEWKAAWEREQAAKNATKTPEQIKAEAEADAQHQIEVERAAREEAEANFKRWQLASGKVPVFAMGLITGKDDDEINEQVTSLNTELENWYQARLNQENGPRRPQPNPLAGRTNGTGETAREQFAATFDKLLNP